MGALECPHAASRCSCGGSFRLGQIVFDGVDPARQVCGGFLLLTKSDAGTLTILGDKDHAGRFEGALDGEQIISVGTSRARFKGSDSRDSDVGRFREIPLRHFNESTGSAALRG